MNNMETKTAIETTTAMKCLAMSTYIGSRCQYKWNRDEDMLAGKLTPKIFESLYYGDGVITHCILTLKPLSKLTDEDAIEVGKILGYTPTNTRPLSVVKAKGTTFCSIDPTDEGFTYHPHKALFAYDYLRSKGYDVPNHYLGGKTLKQAGLAVYE